jgi:hypothetical protein
MSDNNEQASMATKPVKEHEWLQNLVGEWRTEMEFVMEPGGDKQTSQGKESVTSLGGLWAYSQGTSTMPDGDEMRLVSALGYDVSAKEYRGCWFASVSSHLWKYVGELSADGKKMTLNCEGPNMVKEGETALYRDVIDLIDANHRTLTSFAQGEDGEWVEFMKAHYYRV